MAAALKQVRQTLKWAVLFSAGVNLLMLAGPLYMLQIYDRVLTSNSVPTLVGLTVFVIGAYLFQGTLDVTRGKIVARSAGVLDERLQALAHRRLLSSASTGGAADSVQPVRDIDQMRAFILSPGPMAITDAPWMPIFLCICFLIHPWLGVVALVGGLVLIALALLAERRSRPTGEQLTEIGRERALAIESRRRNAESVVAMGMSDRLETRWNALNWRFVGALEASSESVALFGGLSKVARLMLQSMLLGLGAYLVILQQLTPGAMIAASIMMGRALAPIEGAIGQWRGLVAAQQAAKRLRESLGKETASEHTDLPAPKESLSVSSLAVGPPNRKGAVLTRLEFVAKAGDVVAVIGSSGAGKSSLARTLVGVWPAVQGHVRLDGAALDQWSPELLGQHIGYLSQSVELFDGTVAENISRLADSVDSPAVLEAAQASGAHEMILDLPAGYDTEVGEWGSFLSAGQRQRIGLARALYRSPRLIVLDEPNSNLDSSGEAALIRAIKLQKERGAIVLLITHKINLVAVCDLALLLADGVQQAFGPRDDVLKRFIAPAKAAQGGPALSPVAATSG